MSLCEIDIPAWSFVACLGTFTCMMLWSHWRAVRIQRQWCDECGRLSCPDGAPCKQPADA